MKQNIGTIQWDTIKETASVKWEKNICPMKKMDAINDIADTMEELVTELMGHVTAQAKIKAEIERLEAAMKKNKVPK